MIRPAPYLFLCVGHSIDHIFMLLLPALIALSVVPFWGLTYGELMALFTPAAVMFGLGAPVAGWLADRWSGSGMMTVYFIGMGASAVVTGLADGPLALGVGLFLMGTFASIYHPVGIPLIVRGAGDRRGRLLGINGVFGSAGMAVTPVIVGGLLVLGGWRLVFIVPGLLTIALGACVSVRLPRRAGRSGVRAFRRSARLPNARSLCAPWRCSASLPWRPGWSSSRSPTGCRRSSTTASRSSAMTPSCSRRPRRPFWWWVGCRNCWAASSRTVSPCAGSSSPSMPACRRRWRRRPSPSICR